MSRHQKHTKKRKKHSHLAFLFALLLTASVGIIFGYYKFTTKVNANIQEAAPNLQPAPTPNPSPSPNPSPTHQTIPTSPPVLGVQTTSYTGTSVPVLTYHYVGNNPNPQDKARDILGVTPDQFEAQMNYLAQNGYTPISPETLWGIFNKTTTVEKPIMLTFDDGYIDFYLNAYPILQKHHFHAVAFIPTGLVGGGYYMNWGQVKEIQASGLVSFEGHTVSHPNLTTLNYNQVLSELKDSKETLQAQIGAPVNFVAYPYGVSNSFVLSAAQQAGFIGGFGTWIAKATGPGFNLPRIRITGLMSLSDFASRL